MKQNKIGKDEKQIEIYRYNYKNGFIGKGSYGTVYKGYNIINNQPVAIKLIKKSDIRNKDDEKQLLEEIQIMKRFKNPNIVQIYDVYQTDNNYYIILEYCNMGDLENQLLKSNTINYYEHYQFLIDILNAFRGLTKLGIMHRDLKLANILIHKDSKKKHFKLGDFGFAKYVQNYKNQTMDSKVGTPLYMSPQILDGQPYTSKSDIWSLGFILYQFIYIKPPWIGQSEDELLHRIINMPLQFLPQPPISEECKDFISKCLQIKEVDRLGWDTIYKHPYVKNNFEFVNQELQQQRERLGYILKLIQQKIQNENQIEELFESLDTSKDRQLCLQEFSQLIYKIDKTLSKEDIKYIFDEIDKNGNGFIDYYEFRAVILPLKPKKSIVLHTQSNRVHEILCRLYNFVSSNNINLEQLFQKFDISKNGSLDRDEFKQLFRKLDLSNQITDQDVNSIINDSWMALFLHSMRMEMERFNIMNLQPYSNTLKAIIKNVRNHKHVDIKIRYKKIQPSQCHHSIQKQVLDNFLEKPTYFKQVVQEVLKASILVPAIFDQLILYTFFALELMIGQSDFRYELYGLGQDQLINLMMIDKQHLQPHHISKQEDYVFFEYDATKSVKLDVLLQSLPFIALSFKQLLLILKRICEKLNEIQANKLSIQEISLKNIIIFVDTQFCYFETASVIKNVDFLGLIYINTQADRFKWFIQTKRLILSILDLYEKNYIKLLRCASIQQEWNEFQKNINICENYEQCIDQFLKEKLSEPIKVKFLFERELKLWCKYDYLQNEIFEQFKEFLLNQMKYFEEGLELKPQYLKSIIISSLTNQSYIILYKSIDDYFQTTKSYFRSYKIVEQLQFEISNLFDETLKMIKKRYNFNSLFQQLYDDNFASQDNFKRDYNIPQNWFGKLGHKNLMPDFLMIIAKAGYLNSYQNLSSSLKYLEQYPSDQQETIKLYNTPLSPKIFEQFLIQKLQDYHCMVIESLFEQKEQKLIQDIPITNK